MSPAALYRLVAVFWGATYILISSGGIAHAAGPESFLEGGQLRAPLEVRDAQSGFAGVTGTITRIEPDGTFTVSRFLNEKVEEPHEKGKLTGEEYEELVEVLGSRDFPALPPEIGEGPPVNPRTITVSVGDASSTLSFDPGAMLDGNLPSVTAEASGPEKRLLEIVKAVQDATADE